MQISKTNQSSSMEAAFILFLKLILRQNTMNEDEHSDGEFCYPDELESHKENSEEEIENFVKEQKSENTTRKSHSVTWKHFSVIYLQ